MITDISDIISSLRGGVFKIELLSEAGTVLGSGSGFLVMGGIVTNQHVLPDEGYATARLVFGEPEPATFFIERKELIALKRATSQPRNRQGYGKNRDYTYLELDRQEFDGRHHFELAPERKLRTGDGVLYLGYPYSHKDLAAHQGHVASIHYDPQVETDVIQVDGSVNPGNSGGPLINPSTREVEGIITEAETGIILDSFDALQRTLMENIHQLTRPNRPSAAFDGIDFHVAMAATQRAILQVAHTIRRSANVGIGFAFPIEHVRGEIRRWRDG